MTEEIRDPRFDRPFRTDTRVRTGEYPIPDRPRVRAVPCVHCARPMGVSTWDYLNGFLVVCPHCHGYHGKPWGIERTVVAGLFFNCLSFLFTMRPKQATVAIAIFVSICSCLLAVAARDDMNTANMVAALGVSILGPVLVDAVVLIRHRIRLDAAPPARDGTRAT